MSTAMWKLEKDLCRCCHAEGSFKHLSDPCFQLGQEEIYSDMLQDCLDIKIIPMTGVLTDITYTICETCVARLRDASNFKRQVQDCEERFKDMYSKNLIRGFKVKEEPSFNESDDMKQEFQSIDEDDDDAFLNFDDDADADVSLDGRQQITIEVESKAKGKGKAKPKPKPKKPTPVKKTKKEKSIKMETEELTVAAVSGEKKKGRKPDSQLLNFVTIAVAEDGEKTYACNICDKTFRKWTYFTQHYQHVHLKLRKKTFPCVLCNEQLESRHRAKHMDEVHGWEAPTCGACGKKFAYPNLLILHQKIHHMGEKNFKCDKCEMAFATRIQVTQHSYKHTDVRDLKCDFCPKAFKNKKYLVKHLKIHYNDKRYVCKICEEAFVQSSNLKYHMRKRHPEEMV